MAYTVVTVCLSFTSRPGAAFPIVFVLLRILFFPLVYLSTNATVDKILRPVCGDYSARLLILINGAVWGLVIVGAWHVTVSLRWAMQRRTGR
jgi:hypothetical protein